MPAIIACIPVGRQPCAPHRNSVQEPCPRCGQRMWLGPAQQRARERWGLDACCTPCALAQADNVAVVRVVCLQDVLYHPERN